MNSLSVGYVSVVFPIVIHYTLAQCLGQNCAVWDGSTRWELVCCHWTGHREAQTIDIFISAPPPVVAEDLLFPCTHMFTNLWSGYQLNKTPSLPVRSVRAFILFSAFTFLIWELPRPLLANSTVTRCVWASLLAAPGPCRNDWPPRLCNLPMNMSVNMSCQLRRLFPWCWVFLFILYWLKVNS